MRMTGAVMLCVLAVVSACNGDDWIARLQGEWWGGDRKAPNLVLHINGTNVLGYQTSPYGHQAWTGFCSRAEADGFVYLTISKSDFDSTPPMLLTSLDDSTITARMREGRNPSREGTLTFHKIITNPLSTAFEGIWTQRDHPQVVLNVFSNGQGVIAWNGLGMGKMTWAMSNGQAIATALDPRVRGCPERYRCSILTTNYLIGTAEGGTPRIFEKIWYPR